MIKKQSTAIRNLDADLYRKARAAAITAGKSIGAWMNEAIRAYLKGEGGKADKP